MCRFAAYLGHPIRLDEMLFAPEHSIVDQSLEPGEGPVNGDGFGVGWYAQDLDEAPARYRNTTPAWADENMRHIAPRVETNLFLAHVRGASPGMAVQETNCHPFVRGRLLFMHNGHVVGHDEIVRSLRARLSDHAYDAIQGTTDSEHLFALIQDELGEAVEDPSADQLAAATATAIERVEALKEEHEVEEPTRANLALSDGRSLVALRYASPRADDPPNLWVTSGDRFETDTGGRQRVVDPNGDGAYLVSSDPMLEEDTGTELLPANHLLVVNGDRTARLEDVTTTARRLA
jgi:predicted glutamine amidotransferase